jgi:Ca-activated chloride channel family protein
MAAADGVLLVRPPERPVATPLGVTYHRVEVRILDGTAVTRIDQEFRNDYDTDLEASYLFPIPEEAAITDFILYVNGKPVGGEILDRDQARRIYEQIVREMRDPGLLEYAGRNLFRASVYPVPAKGRARIELEYSETLRSDAGLYRYRYPLDTERFSPSPLDEVTIAAEIESSVDIKNVYSPSHDVDIRVAGTGRNASVGYEAKKLRPDRDFLLYYTVSERDLGMNLLAFRESGEPGYFLLMISPGELEGRTQGKDVIFVLDTSGSMSGEKIEQARSALRYCIDSLGAHDRFDIVQFATTETSFRGRLVPADGDQVASAHRFIDRLRARGGTNIGDALQTALGIAAAGAGRSGTGSRGPGPQMIVFLTDGEPTVGETDLKAIDMHVRNANVSQVRLFVFGVGNDVNTHLLDRLAEQNRGVSEYVRPDENIEVQVSTFFRKVSEQVLANIDLDYGRGRVSEVYPLRLPDLFRGSRLIVLGRYEGSGSTAVALTGTVQGRTTRFTYEPAFPRETLDNDFIPRLWATRKIGHLMGEIRLNGEREELIDEIVGLSKEYGILTPYTSYLVLEHDDRYEEYGLEPSPELRARGSGYRDAMESEKGEEAVMSSMDISALKESKTPRRSELETVKWAGHKTFYLRDGFWVDSEYREGMKVEEIEFLGREYFRLLERNPGLERYFALASNVVVVYDSKCYRVVDESR